MEPEPSRKIAACPHCGARLRLLPEHLEESFRCPKCNKAISAAQPPPPDLSAQAVDEYQIADSRPATAAEVHGFAKPSARSGPGGEIAKTAGKKQQIHVEAPPTLDPNYRAPSAFVPPAPPLPHETDFLEARGHRHDPVEEHDEYELEPPVERPAPVAYVEPARTLMRETMAADPLPSRPEWTFVSGVFNFPWYRDTLARWLMMSIGLAATGELVLLTAVNIGLFGGVTQASAVFAGFVGMPAIWICVFTLAYAAAYCLAVLQDTAAGLDVVQSWPESGWKDAFWSIPLPLYVALCSMTLGYLVGIFTFGNVCVPLGVFLLFPILLLSALESDQLILPHSPAVLSSLREQWRVWVVFYAEAAVLAGGWLLPVCWGLWHAPFLTLFLSAPVSAAVLLIYARLLGRLGWRISEGLDDAAEDAAAGKPARAWLGRKKRRVRRGLERIEERNTEQWLESQTTPEPPSPNTIRFN